MFFILTTLVKKISFGRLCNLEKGQHALNGCQPNAPKIHVIQQDGSRKTVRGTKCSNVRIKFVKNFFVLRQKLEQ